MPPGLPFFLRTFGCKTNQYESEGIREALRADGFWEVPTPSEAAICILNTCCVTSRAEATCRRAVRAIRRENPQAFVVLTGCAVDLPSPWLHEIGIDLAISNREKIDLPLRIREALHPSTSPRIPPSSQWAEPRFAFSLKTFASHTRAFLKIQDGCDAFCSYCIVPYVRGRPASRPLEAIQAEAEALVASGHRELVVTGIHIGAYRDEKGRTLADLLRMLSLPPGVRLRLSSIEPYEVTDDLLAAIRSHPAICPHLHLPLQSGDDRVLQAMNRRYTRQDYLEAVRRIRDALDRPAITTDIIVGFPTEDEAAFEATYQLAEKVGFARTHIFLFSPRTGTPASRLPRSADDTTVFLRKERLLRLAATSAARFAASWIGEKEAILVETAEGSAPSDDAEEEGDRKRKKRLKNEWQKNGGSSVTIPRDSLHPVPSSLPSLAGYSRRYLWTYLSGDPSWVGKIVEVRIVSAQGPYLYAEAIPPESHLRSG